jgi:lipoprotein NlpI
MDSRKARAIIQQIYDTMHMARWTFGFAMIAYFIVFIVPRISEARAKAESQQILEILAESRFYCEKWNMREGTHEYTQCALDLQEIRAKIAKRITDDMDF